MRSHWTSCGVMILSVSRQERDVGDSYIQPPLEKEINHVLQKTDILVVFKQRNLGVVLFPPPSIFS